MIALACAEYLVDAEFDGELQVEAVEGFEDRARLAALLSAISRDGPRIREAEARSIAVPTLAIATGMDIAHPMTFAEILAETVPGARLVEIPPKASDAPRYIAEFRAALSSFLSDVARSKGPLP